MQLGQPVQYGMNLKYAAWLLGETGDVVVSEAAMVAELSNWALHEAVNPMRSKNPKLNEDSGQFLPVAEKQRMPICW